MRSEIQQIWRRSLVKMLQEAYGLPEEEARTKVDVWFKRLAQSTKPDTTIELPLSLTERRPLRSPPPRIQRMATRQRRSV